MPSQPSAVVDLDAVGELHGQLRMVVIGGTISVGPVLWSPRANNAPPKVWQPQSVVLAAE